MKWTITRTEEGFTNAISEDKRYMLSQRRKLRMSDDDPIKWTGYSLEEKPKGRMEKHLTFFSVINIEQAIEKAETYLKGILK